MRDITDYMMSTAGWCSPNVDLSKMLPPHRIGWFPKEPPLAGHTSRWINPGRQIDKAAVSFRAYYNNKPKIVQA